MELKIPPPLVALIAAGVMWIVAEGGGASSRIVSLPLPLPLALFVTGAALEIWAAIQFRRAATTINPLRPDRTARLITDGVYRFSRNPMYLGLLIMLLSWTLWLGHPANIAVLLLYIWFVTRFQIIPEERVLERLFPQEFAAYRSRVRRWI